MPYYPEDVETEKVLGEKYVVYTGAEEWDALYVDGKLECVGDRYLIDERLREILGCVQVDSAAYFMGGKGYPEDVPKDLATVEAYRTTSVRSAQEARAQAAALRAQAAELEASARELEGRTA